MGTYRTDLKDVYFNLFDVLEVDKNREDVGRDDIVAVIDEMDKFVANEVFPSRTPSDEEGVKLTDEGVKVGESLKKPHGAYYENGWYGLNLPEEIGGMEVPNVIELVCGSMCSSANMAWMMYPTLTKGAMRVIYLKGTEEQKAKYIPKMMDGTWGGTMCLTEAGAGSDVGALLSKATPLENGKYKIEGTKIFISVGENDLYKNNIHLVLARTPEGKEGTKGISLFIVPQYKINEDGSQGESNDVKCTKVEEKMGIHAQATCELVFGGNGNCEGELIGDEFDGMATMFIMMNEARLATGVQGEATANLSYEMARQFASERSQFGKEIQNYPDVKRMLLKMRAMSRGMRALAYYTSNLFDFEDKQPEAEGVIGLLTPVCKSYFSDQGLLVASDAVQTHGGYGFCSEYGVEQFMRDVKISAIYEGTNGIQAIDYVMRKILKDRGKSYLWLLSHIDKTLGKMSRSDWKKEKKVFKETLGYAKKIFRSLGMKGMKKDYDGILDNCSDFLTFSGHLFVAWRLFESALVAHEKLKAGNTEDAEYLKEKIEDAKVFTKHYLIHAPAYAKTIIDL